MKRFFLLFNSFILSLFIYLPCRAADILPEQALQIASDFVQHDRTAQKNLRHQSPINNHQSSISPTIAHKMPSRVAQDKDNVYVVNLGDNQGFVVVSGETGTESEVLGYCDHGSFDINNAPIQFFDLLKEYSDGIDSLRKDPSLARPQLPAQVQSSVPSYMGKVIVGPLLTTRWNQWAPYNNLCPANANEAYESFYGGHCPSGCVPTAVAQVMNYWKWPKQGKGQVYVGWSAETGNQYEDFPVHTYDWDHMLDAYGWTFGEYGSSFYASYSYTEAQAVAQLMADIGKAMATLYCQPNGSPTGFSSQALVDNFSYEPGIEMISGTKAADVRGILMSELDAQRPVLYAGQPDQGDGHALVCDGYTANGYFHFNYGWGGQNDGFYRLSAIPIYINHVQVMTNVRPYDAEEKEIGNIKYGLLANGTADILSYLGGGMNVENGVLVIPDSVTDPDTGNRYAVTHIRKESFYNVGHFTKIVMGNHIEAIDPISFLFTTIDTLVLSDKMEVVPEEAFQLTDIRHLTIGENIKVIGKRAFYLCPLTRGIVCKSRQVELDTESFAGTTPVHGDWEEGIVKINKRAFNGSTLSPDTEFKNLEVLGDCATCGGIWGRGSYFFYVGPKVREIAPSAFDEMYSPMLIVDTLNPYYTTDWSPIIYNKDTTRVIIALSSPRSGEWCDKIIKMEPGCARGAGSFLIPPTVVDMEGAFKDYKASQYSYSEITCPIMVPPVITDATFSDEMFARPLILRVPPGTEALYAEAPGWRKFGENIQPMYEEFTPLPPQDLHYHMQLHSDTIHTSAAVADISSMRMTEDENGHPVVTLSVNGREDIALPAGRVDSITFKPGFIYENAEIFEINDSNLTVNAQKCSITFDATTFDDSVQICVRNSVLLPRPSEGVTGGIGIDISMLADSGLVHGLSGIAKITIPLQVPADQAVGAAYYNEQTGEWEPVYMQYNRETGTATILTDHLSFYSVVTFLNERSKGELFEALREIPALYAWDEGTKLLLKILESDDPKVEEALQFKNEMGLWQSLGLDGFYNGAVSISEPLFGFKPEAIDNAVTIMGEIGTAMTILDVVRADLQGDNISVAANTIKVIMAKTAGAAATYIGTPVMAASMSLVAFIGVALEKFGTTVQEFKMDYFRSAYRYYYSMEGYRALRPDSRYNQDINGKDKPHGYFRTTKDWYDYFYPAFVEANMSDTRLQSYIEQSVRVYCDQFWTETADLQTWAFAEARKQGFQSLWEATDALKQQISDEYYAELMNGTLVSVFAALRNNQIVQANNRAVSKINSMAKWMNRKVAFRIIDSSCKEGERSQFAGRMIGFDNLPDDLADPQSWRKPIGEDGKVPLGWFTTYALVRNMMPFQITLFDEKGEPEKVFDFQLDGVADKTIIDIDPATQGVRATTKHLDDLKLNYQPQAIMFYSSGYDMRDQYADSIVGEYVYINDSIEYYKNVRYRTELEKFFNAHNYITVDSTDNYTLGDDITGKFVGDKASGQFTINTDHRYLYRTLQQFVDTWNNPKADWVERFRHVLSGSMKHQIACRYTITRRQEEDHYEYDITYTGEGAYDLTVRYITHFNKTIDWSGMVEGEANPIAIDDLSVGPVSNGGDLQLEYKVTIK